MQVRPIRTSLVATFALAAAPVAAQPSTQPRLSPADQAAAFRAAGFKKVGRQWQGCGDPGTAGYSPGEIETVRDIDGDGRLDAIITESSVFCFGNTGTGYTLVSKQANGTWKKITGGPGMVTILRRAATGWPDLEIGGPGFCFPVERWNGREYALHRHQYDGKPCRPPQ